MPEYTTEDIRNLALLGHGGTGKTTLGEAMLLAAGVTSTRGETARGTSTFDFDSQEREHGHSLNAALASLDHLGAHINLIDVPGYPDLMGRALSVVPAVESVAVVLDARTGVDATARRIMALAAERRVCRMLVVNRIDAEGVDLPGLMAAITEAFGSECLPMNLPTGDGLGVVDCFFRPGEATTAFSSVADAHTRLVDQVVEVDEELMELYLEQGEEVQPERLHDAFEEALREGHLVPVCFVSALSGVGVRELLEIIARLMPNPREGNPPRFFRGPAHAPEAVEVLPDTDRPVVAHVFRVTVDAFVGRMGIFRIHQGRVTKDSQLYVGEARKPFKVGHLFRLQGKEHQEIDAGIPGDLCAVAKVDEVRYDAVLHEGQEGGDLWLEPIELPEPMFGLAISAKARGDEQKLSDALSKLAAEDPCFRVEHHASLNETVVRGLGELHLRVTLEKMRERYNVEVETRPPRIAYRETIRRPAEGHHRHKKQTGGAGQFGEVYLRVEPLSRGAGFEFVDKVVGGVIPNQFIPAVEKGVRQVLETGAISGYPLQDVRVTVHDGKHHPVDSKEVAFVTAGRKAFLDAVAKADPVILEPIVHLQVTVPQERMGDITGDLSSRRGRINGTEALAGGRVTVAGLAPLSELGNYPSHLKSVTGGAGAYTMEFSHYEPVPASVQQQLTAEFSPRAEED
jgi:elongation factor G